MHTQEHRHDLHIHTHFDYMSSMIPTTLFILEINRTEPKGRSVNHVGQFGIGSPGNLLFLRNEGLEA